MKPYGVDRQDCSCCPGHSKFSKDCYSSNRSKKAHSKASRVAHKRARARVRSELFKAQNACYDYDSEE